MSPTSSRAVSRRTALAVAGAAAVVAVPACASYSSGGAPPPPQTSPGGAPPPTGPGGAGSAPLARSTDIPVGGGTVFADRQVVVTQPQGGTFAAFDTTCPHQGCTVNEVVDGTINCPCHGSRFRIADGSVETGPAARGLAARQVRVTDGSITLA